MNRFLETDAGETKEEVTFVDIDSFGKQAEILSQYLKKGSPLMVEGRLKLDQWDDKQTGQKRSRLGVVLEGFQFIGAPASKGGSDFGGEHSAPAPPETHPWPNQLKQMSHPSMTMMSLLITQRFLAEPTFKFYGKN